MRRAVLILFAALPGCSTAPIAGFLDTVAPSRVFDDRGPRTRDRERDRDRDREPELERIPPPRRDDDPFLLPPRLDR